ncbi:MAG: ATPase [Cytophaga sp.]|nr:ATPase [Cytophaga sp.]
MQSATGLTKSAGWEMGVRRTFPVSTEDAWRFLFSKNGLTIWLGKTKALGWKKGEPYVTSEGVEGVLKVFKEFSHVRLTWKRKAWAQFSTLQVRLIKTKDKTTISFHQERLSNAAQRKEMLAHWTTVLDIVEKKWNA